MSHRPVCQDCADGRFDPKALATYGHRCVGTCQSGGPDPEGKSGAYCSDTGPEDTCPRWRAKQ